MAIPPWTYGLLRRGITDVAKRASETEAVERLKQQASDLLQELPEVAAKGIDAVLKKTEVGKKSIENWSKRQSPFQGPIINASGTLFHPTGTGSSMSNAAIEIGKEILSGDLSSNSINYKNFDQRLQRTVPESLGYSICIAHNLDAAITLVGTQDRNQTIAIHENQKNIEIAGMPLIERLKTLTQMRVVGIDEYESSEKSPEDSGIELWVQNNRSPAPTRRMNAPHSPRMIIANLCSLAEKSRHQIPSCWSLLKDDRDWVITPGNRILGGPECALIIGPKQALSELRNHHLWPSLKASEAVSLMMLVTMELGLANPDGVPIQALLNTSLDNVRSRTERLAIRIGSTETIQECRVKEGEAYLSSDQQWTLPSQQLLLRHQSLNADQWNRKLIDDYPCVLTTVNEDKLCVDLRWVHPADDAKLGEIFGGTVH